MKRLFRKFLSALCAGVTALSLLPAGALALGAEGDFLKQSGHLESAYIEWAPVEGATGYRVYVKPADAADSAYVQLDDQLVRRYPTYWRADALGLAAGSYVMKVTPARDGADMDDLVTDPLEVLAHDRSGYAFADGNVPGAYNMDGTLKSGAKVVYVTNDNKNSVKLGSYTGLESIVQNVGRLGAPVDVRIIGKITDVNSACVLNIKTPKANLTIEGVGNDATAYGWGFGLSGCSHVELRNLGVMLVKSAERDGVTLDKSDYTWVHNCDFFYNVNDPSEGDKKKGDGSLDTKKSHYVTHSYNHFWDSGKCNLQGSNTSDTSDCITYHHNWYDHSDSRHPRVRVAHVHVYNNYYDHNDQYGIGAVHHATVFADRNYFDNCQYPMLISMQGSDPGYFTGNNDTGEAGGMIKAYGNEIVGGTYVPWSAAHNVEFDAYEVSDPKDTVPGDVKSKPFEGEQGWTYDNFDTTGFYTYTADDAADVPAKVRAYAGRVEGGDFSFDMTKLTYGVKTPNAELLAALENYTCALDSVGGGSTGSGGETPDPGPAPDPGPGILGGTTYTLTGNEVYALLAAGKGPSNIKLGGDSNYPDSYRAGAQTSHKAGTGDFFTLRYASNSRIDPVPISFPAPNAFEGQYRINFKDRATANANCVEFTTDGPASVKVWWTGGVAAGESKTLRPMVVLDAGGTAVGTSETVNNSTTPMVTQFSLPEGGTYRLGGKEGKNYIYKVTVTVGSSLDGLAWNVDGSDKLTVTGEIPSGEKVWVACWDSADRFLGVHGLDARHLETQLDPAWKRLKLIWLDVDQAPKCSAAEAEK